MKRDNPVIVPKAAQTYVVPLCLLITINEEKLICTSETERVGDEDGQW